MISILKSIQDFSDIVPRIKFVPHPERVVFDLLERGVLVEGEHRYSNHGAGLIVGQSSFGWSSGVLRLAVRLLNPPGLRRLALVQTFIINKAGNFVCPPLEQFPIRMLFPLNVLKVGDAEYFFDSDLRAGTEIRLKLDVDLMTLQLQVGDWDSGVIRLDPQLLSSPLYPAFLFDSGDAFEVLPR
eukprot:EG_transcript_11327